MTDAEAWKLIGDTIRLAGTLGTLGLCGVLTHMDGWTADDAPGILQPGQKRRMANQLYQTFGGGKRDPADTAYFWRRGAHTPRWRACYYLARTVRT